MASYNKFQQFVQDLLSGVHNLFGDAGASPPTADILKVYLSNAAPSASADAVKADMAEITNENGYTAPIAVNNTGTRTGGTATVDGISVQVSASGSVGPFQYVVLYNDTPTSPADPLIAWWDRGSPLTLGSGETFDIKFNNSAVGVAGDIFTLA